MARLCRPGRPSCSIPKAARASVKRLYAMVSCAVRDSAGSLVLATWDHRASGEAICPMVLARGTGRIKQMADEDHVEILQQAAEAVRSAVERLDLGKIDEARGGLKRLAVALGDWWVKPCARN